MRTLPLAIVGVVAYAAFLVALMPARFVAAQVEKGTGGALRIRDAQGTAWHGTARGEVAIPGSVLPLESVAWRLEPARLLQGRIEFAVDAKAAGLTAQGTIARAPSSWHAAGQLAGNAAAASTLVPLLSAWRPEGRVAIRTDGFEWTDREARGEVQAEWSDAALALAQVRPLGAYRATLHAEGPSGKLSVATLDGPLRITGLGDIVFPSAITFNGEARAVGPAAPSLDPLLDLMGPRRPDGARTLAWRSR
jgi:Bacterial type II secretion system protein N.